MRRLGRWAAVALLAAAYSAPHAAPAANRDPAQARVLAPAGPVARALRGELTRAGQFDLVQFYQSRAFLPLWVRGRRVGPEAAQLVALLRTAADDGLDPARYDPDGLQRAMAAARSRAPDDLARAEAALSRAFTAYVRDLRTPPPSARMTFTDPALSPPAVSPAAVLQAAAGAEDLSAHLDEVRRMNPVYERLRQALAEHRARSGASREEALILANLARARQIPADPGRRFVVVDAAGARLWLFEDGRIAESMSVVVGKPEQATPMLAGVIRYAVYNPYWNIPVDLAQSTYAASVLRDGPAALQAEGVEVLSDWSDRARPVEPESVDWTAVAAGRRIVRLRQRPGPDNMMGQVKLMLPNELGIYLHDTPHRWAFAASLRAFSSGCVRLERALPLAERLLGAAAPRQTPAGAERRIDLPEPVPVFITYFTVWPGAAGLERRRDLYRRDAAVLAELGLGGGPIALAMR